MQKTIFILNFGPDFFARYAWQLHSVSSSSTAAAAGCWTLFCHQKQYNFGASRLREKELTKEKMSYVSWHANILEYNSLWMKIKQNVPYLYSLNDLGILDYFVASLQNIFW